MVYPLASQIKRIAENLSPVKKGSIALLKYRYQALHASTRIHHGCVEQSEQRQQQPLPSIRL